MVIIEELEAYLNKNKFTFFLKYDYLREKNHYTAILFDSEKGENVEGGDTSTIESIENKINLKAGKVISFDEINNLFYTLKNATADLNLTFFIIGLNFSGGKLEYRLTISGEVTDIHKDFKSYQELQVFVAKWLRPVLYS